MTELIEGKLVVARYVEMCNSVELDILHICGESIRLDLVDRVELAISEAISQLTLRPDKLGKTLYRVSKLGLTIRCLALAPLYFEFGIHEGDSTIVIRKVGWLVHPASR